MSIFFFPKHSPKQVTGTWLSEVLARGQALSVLSDQYLSLAEKETFGFAVL